MKTMLSTAAIAACLAAVPCAAFAADNAEAPATIVVIGDKPSDAIAPPQATQVTTTAQKIATTVNAVSVEDTLKYFPSLVIRKRSIGDNFAPIATRTSGLGASARSLIYADGALLSALIGNNNGNGSPRWTLVTPSEVASVDVLYGPFSAAYAGNSIGTVVNITTRMPDKLEARASVLTNVQQFSLYGTDRTLPTWQFSGSLGGKLGNLSLLASATRTTANTQPISFTTLTGTASAAPTRPAGTTGGYADLNKIGQNIIVLGAGGLEHHVQDSYKLKAAIDLTPSIRAAYTLGIWHDDTQGAVESYGQATAGGISYLTSASNTSTTGFNSAVYVRNATHFSHVLNISGDTARLNWQVIGTLYNYAHDWQNNPSPDTATGTALATGFVGTRNDLPAAFAGGVGTIQKQDGTGWVTLDAKAALHLGQNDAQVLSFGAHGDKQTLKAATYTIANWLDSSSALGQIRSASYGNTRTLALWAQDAIKLTPDLKLTIGGRQEWWRAYNGANTALSTTVNTTIAQPARSFAAFSPKASIAWQAGDGLLLRLSAGQAWRFPTVGELYQSTTVGTQFFNPNANLLPERARSLELAAEHRSSHGFVRVSLFNEVIQNALILQTTLVTLPDNSTSSVGNVQNVEQTRARGVELAFERSGIAGQFDLSGSVTYADAIVTKNTTNPASVGLGTIGKLLPSVPHWKANAVLTWHPTKQISLTTAARYASRNYANLANDDSVGNTYQGFYKYLVVDVRATFHVTDQFDFALGVDNLNNDKYFLFHPFPQRSFTAQVNWKL